MPPNKKKNKQKNKSGGAVSSSTKNGDGGANNKNLNAEVLEALTRLADKLAQLDVACDHDEDEEAGEKSGCDDGSNVAAELANDTAALSLNDGNGEEMAVAPENNAMETSPPSPAALSTTAQSPPPPTATITSTVTNPPPAALPLSHWRTLPLPVSSAYQILTDGAQYLHATSTKYALVGKVDSHEGGNLAIELRKGAELIGTATLLLFSPSCGSSRSLRKYVKQSSRAILASVISLVASFEDGSACGQANDGNNVGAQKTGAVWSSCEKITNARSLSSLPKGNRSAMRRELMVWLRDCNESVEEFEEVLLLGPRDSGGENDGEGGGEDDMMDEEQFTEKEMTVAKASVNVMKCSKNLLGLVLKACECVGEAADKKLLEDQEEGTNNNMEQTPTNNKQQEQEDSDNKRKEMLQWISNLHEMARTVGEGVTNVGILLYPPLDSSSNAKELQKWQAKKQTRSATKIIPSLGSTTLGLQLEHQLYALSECIASVNDAASSSSPNRIIQSSCLSKEVIEGAERLQKALGVRIKEVQEAMAVWDDSVATLVNK
ncbi:hypothetical protein ACHAXR_003385 [Thalassiosira sp. AJA248-18]